VNKEETGVHAYQGEELIENPVEASEQEQGAFDD
jgi:hypothetical protein